MACVDRACRCGGQLAIWKTAFQFCHTSYFVWFYINTCDTFRLSCPRGLTFTWWGCCGFCFWHKPTELAHSFFFFFLNSVLVSVSVFMALSIVFHSMNSPDNSSLSHSVLPVLFLSASLVLSTIYFFMKVSLSPDITLCGGLGLKHQQTN